VRSLLLATPDGSCASLAAVSHGEYGTPEGLVFGFPVVSDGMDWHVVEGLSHSDFARERIAVTTEELVSERAAVRDLLLGPI
jgi:malate dehydrogenase